MPDLQDWKDGDDETRLVHDLICLTRETFQYLHSGRYQVSRRNLRNNPHIAAWHFNQRFRSFFDNVFKPKFGVTDSWFRYEFQGRGSTHVHGFAWIDPAIVPEVMGNLQEQVSREEFAQFWSKHVFAVNPDLQRQPPARREEAVDFDRISSGETAMAVMRRIDWDRRMIQRLRANNEATSSQVLRRGPSQLSQSVLDTALAVTVGDNLQGA